MFRPITKQMIWGSESWDISCRPNEMGIIENGPCAGETFEAYIARNPEAVLGTHLTACEKFPLLVKLIDARESLSVQVHPDDAYARAKGEADSGKSEMWYVIKPPDEGHLIIGLKPGTTREMLTAAYQNGTVEQYLNRLPVQAGDIVNIPAGLIHALTAGVVVAEVQQNSDITYRLYDYNRVGVDGKPRQLHVEDALAVIDFDERIHKKVVEASATPKNGSETIMPIISCEHFTIHKYTLSEPLSESSDPEAFCIFTCVEGSVTIESKCAITELSAGRSAFMPAAMGNYIIRPHGHATLLRSSPASPICPHVHNI